MLVYSREAQREYAKQHYQLNKEKYKARAKVNQLASRERGYAFVYEYLRNHPCVDCGEEDILVLQFDHRDREAKKANVSRMINGGYGLETLQAEIDKCDIRCANCHARRTHSQLGWREKI